MFCISTPIQNGAFSSSQIKFYVQLFTLERKLQVIWNKRIGPQSDFAYYIVDMDITL